MEEVNMTKLNDASSTTRQPFCRVFFVLHSANKNYKAYFETLNDFKLKNVQLQSCITSQDLQLLYWSIIHSTKRY
jgi:hypothetical protein